MWIKTRRECRRRWRTQNMKKKERMKMPGNARIISRWKRRGAQERSSTGMHPQLVPKRKMPSTNGQSCFTWITKFYEKRQCGLVGTAVERWICTKALRMKDWRQASISTRFQYPKKMSWCEIMLHLKEYSPNTEFVWQKAANYIRYCPNSPSKLKKAMSKQRNKKNVGGEFVELSKSV